MKDKLINNGLIKTDLIKKLVLSSEWRFHQKYQSWLTKYRIKKELVTLVEICAIAFAALFCLSIFWIYVNKSSTQWYFLRQARSDYNDTVFKYEIIKTDVLDLKKINRDQLTANNRRTSMWVNVEIVNID